MRLLIVPALLLLVGCSPYINIPQQPGDVATHSPNDGTVIGVMSASLAKVLDQRPKPTDYVIVLPQRASKATYQEVLKDLPAGGARHAEGAGGLPIYSVAAVYVRGPRAQVEVIRPTPGGEPQLVSVYLELGIDGWYARRLRPWSISIQEAMRQSYPGREIE